MAIAGIFSATGTWTQLGESAVCNGSGAPREVHNVCGSVYHGVPPAMTEIFEAARSGDTILVYRVDRLGRNMKVFVPWLDKLSGR